jgi:hypothetical protein
MAWRLAGMGLSTQLSLHAQLVGCLRACIQLLLASMHDWLAPFTMHHVPASQPVRIPLAGAHACSCPMLELPSAMWYHCMHAARQPKYISLHYPFCVKSSQAATSYSYFLVSIAFAATCMHTCKHASLPRYTKGDRGRAMSLHGKEYCCYQLTLETEGCESTTCDLFAIIIDPKE